jgi:hypothetical protein
MRNIHRILLALLACLLIPSCGKTAGHSYFCSLYRSENTNDDYPHIVQKLDAWLVSSGLTRGPAPSATPPGGGLNKDETESYYTLTVDGKPILLRLALNQRARQIDAYIDYGGTYTDTQLTDVKHACVKLWNDLFDWIGAQPETNDIVTHDHDWFVKSRKQIAGSYKTP